MSNKLDSAHPFRANVDLKSDVSAPDVAPAPQVELPKSSAVSAVGASTLLEKANSDFKNEQRDTINLDKQAGVFKKKAKLLGGALAATVVFYASLAVYDTFNAPPSSLETIQAMQSSFDEDDYSGTRDVEEARGSVSIFTRLFCRGGHRSTFCN